MARAAIGVFLLPAPSARLSHGARCGRSGSSVRVSVMP